MSTLEFTRNESPTIGVEIELQLVDAETLSLSSSIEKVIAGLPAGLAERVKPELMQWYMEINTGICRTVAEVGEDLNSTIEAVERVTDDLGLR